jgi:hypothetical protein
MTSDSLIRPALVPFPSSIEPEPADPPIDGARFWSHGHELTAAVSVSSVAAWAKAAAVAFLVIVGATALDFGVLWSASARVIERLPF